MKVIVADTSALMRLYVPDGPIPDGLEGHVESAWRAETAILVPEIALAEIAQVLWKKEKAGLLTASETDEILAAVLELPMEVIGHRDLLADAMLLARTHGLTVYDTLFLTLAEKMKAEMFTADRKLLKVFSDTRSR